MSSNRVLDHAWSTFLCRDELPDGREVQMPQWVMDHACANVDASTAAAIRHDPDGWRLCNAYLWRDDIDGDAFEDIDEARTECDRYNRERDVVPLVIPSSWAVVGAPRG